MVLRSGWDWNKRMSYSGPPKLYSEAVAMIQAINEGHDFKINCNKFYQKLVLKGYLENLQILGINCTLLMVFPIDSIVKTLPAMLQETWVWSLVWEDPLEKDMATYSCILAWRIQWTEELGRLQFIRLQRVRHNLSNLAHTHVKMDWFQIVKGVCQGCVL